ncbi:aspartate/tyrosine/aromatic aminotransferase [Woeseiaceae bacterium]|nr:aspartate/tyrosine/aromatic aminotransferase [Woeseiaceae bacterium]
MFEDFPLVPPDPILKLIVEHKNDSRANKIDLGVGVYRDATGNTPIMEVVKEAEHYLLDTQQSKAYIGLAGDADFNSAMQNLILDQNITDDRFSTIQTAGGSTSLRVAIELIRKSSKDLTVWVSEPTWNNHIPILDSVGVKVAKYPYYDAVNNQLDFEGLIECLNKIPSGDIVLLHACCHNPTGMDPSPDQWKVITEVIVKRNIIPFIDNAYQGLANSLSEDAFVVKLMAGKVREMLIASSCSKNFGLYRDRAGTLTIVSENAKNNLHARSHILKIVRTMCSVPPDHGCAVVSHILNNDKLRNKWVIELNAVKNRLKEMRALLSQALNDRTTGFDSSHLIKANGMFSYLGVTAEQVQKMKNKHGVYMEGAGRINVAGITKKNVTILADAIVDVL